MKVRFSWRLPSVRLRVVGVMKAKGSSFSSWRSLDDTVCVPLTTRQQRLVGNPYVDRLVLFFKKEADVYSIIDSVKHVLRKRHRGKDDFIGYWIPKGNIQRLAHTQRMIKIALGSIASFSLFVGGIGMMNMCFVSVGEKTREIGLRKSVGAKRIHIFWQFLTESICLCFCGSILGIAGGWFAAHGIARLAVRIVPILPEWPVVLSGYWILISVIFSIFMGVGFGVYRQCGQHDFHLLTRSELRIKIASVFGFKGSRNLAITPAFSNYYTFFPKLCKFLVPLRSFIVKFCNYSKARK